MARPLRIEYPGAYYHVLNRGNQRQVVFRCDNEYELFLARLAEFSNLYNVQVLCYCLMPNHFHLYLRTREANLSRFMQSFLTSFSLRINLQRRSSGHLFQGRFKAQLVERTRYGNELSRYIHLNPIRTKPARVLPVESKRRLLRDYEWSSYAACIGLRKKPTWLHYNDVLRTWGKRCAEQMPAYRTYVEQGLLRDIEDPAAALDAWTILGSENFIDRIKRTYLLARQSDAREQRELVHLQGSFAMADILTTVATICGVDVEAILQRRSGAQLARRIGMFCACKYCRGNRSLTDIARQFGVSVSGLTRARDRVATASTDATVGALLARIAMAVSAKKSTA